MLFKVSIIVFRLFANLDLKGVLKCFICIFCKMGHLIFFLIGSQNNASCRLYNPKASSGEMDCPVCGALYWSPLPGTGWSRLQLAYTKLIATHSLLNMQAITVI